MSRPRAALVLAAGKAQRFGQDKLLQDFRGAPLLAHAVNAARAAPVERIVIIRRSGHGLEALCDAFAAEDDRILVVAIESQALSESLRAGLSVLSECDGVFVFLGDMPLVPHGVAGGLASRVNNAFAALPVYQGSPGHPVLLSARAVAQAEQLAGDQGAGALLRAHADEVARMDVDDEGVVRDIDTAEDLKRMI